ncbi:MAG: hypothetical protein HRU09_12150 [Oligoflexales bacterium]|nr:hypothetical protein [Oligoflexales bacterium]
MADQWLSIVEYARCFNISDMTVRRRIKNGKLHAVLKEGKYYIPIAEEASPAPSRRAHSVEEVVEPTPREYYKPRWDEDVDEEDYYEAPKPVHTHERTKEARPRYPQDRYKSHFTSHEEKRPHQGSPYFGNKKFKKNEIKRPQKELREFDRLPKEITSNLDDQSSSPIETEALLNFCNQAMRSLDDSKKALEDSFKNKVEALEEKTKALEAQLGEKSQKVDDLKQKVEDFQLLIKIIESAKKKA